ncbi:MAG TPA: DUF4936 family protein [Burkholderiales bacterium]|nr:DUF4936 family protein [Burkholderiales bacterium]
MPLSYFVYYRVRQPGRARALVREILATVERETGVAGRLLGKRDDAQTWMEVYEGVDDAAAFEASLEASVRSAGFDAVLQSGSRRHLECFETPCA